MAPEQLDGGRTDERTDIFAFGLVLYELLTGRHAFEAKTAERVRAGILERPPAPPSSFQPGIPPAVEEVVLTCLAKDPAERWQSMRELRHALQWASRPPEPAVRRRRRVPVAAGIAAAVIVVMTGAGVSWWRRAARPVRARSVRMHVALPPGTRLMGVEPVALSPDGETIAFSALTESGSRVFTRRLDALVPTALQGAESGSAPFWSPDSRQIAYWGRTGLRKVDRAGGPAQLICQGCRPSMGGGGVTHGAAWGAAGVIVYSEVGRLFRVSAQGGQPQALGPLVPGETGRFWPQFLPDGRHYLYLSLASRRDDEGIYVGALDSALRKLIVATAHSAAYSPPGYLLYIREGALVAQPFDAARLTLWGEPTTVLDEEVAQVSGAVTGAPALFSVSANGVLAWRPGPAWERQQATWIDRSGRILGTVGGPGALPSPALSPDNKSVALCLGEGPPQRDLWIVDVASGASRRLTFDPHDDCGVAWSPDGKSIVFFSDRRGVREIYHKRVDGSGDDELLVASRDFPLHPESWSADGRFVSYNTSRTGQGHDLFLLPVSTRGASPVPFLATPAMETSSAFAPNGRYLAYMSTESGAMEVYVREVTRQGRPGPGKWQISGGSGFSPVWRADGKEMFYVDRSAIFAVGVETDGATFHAGVPRPLGVKRDAIPAPSVRYSVTRDGQRFLIPVPVQEPEPIRILVNWLPLSPS
jgi:Tol biopolymer transport system component